ncbi:GNAT family N-acetyltransferase [Minwuia sp.]|uniref:GNAT family N-acetyltransferase n=1 Tax=Minwuia sp. TaxID=2493630 RepID=UPI003A8E2D1C
MRLTTTIAPAPADFDRWPEVLELLRDAFAYMADRIDPPSSMNRLDLDGLRAKAGREIALIAWQGDEIVGCAFLDPRPDCLYVGKVAVTAQARGQGLARQFFEQAEAMAHERGLAYLELQTRVELLENHETFRRLGFVKTGEDAHAGYRRPTSITMRRPTKPALRPHRPVPD